MGCGSTGTTAETAGTSSGTPCAGDGIKVLASCNAPKDHYFWGKTATGLEQPSL